MAEKKTGAIILAAGKSDSADGPGPMRKGGRTTMIQKEIDTLRQAVHRIPRRFLFIRWGTKALRQEIVSTNPHTRIVYAEYVKIER